ncbi:hypothetical protein DL96DRAFT_1666280 [Flagelloscypha sp. PMI_526]|nr:hypothetical protein DL96DRAFT_1666280 [Flagelloscypha sp. PMI_526]
MLPPAPSPESSSESPPVPPPAPKPAINPPSPILDDQTKNTFRALKGPPTHSFKDNLLSDTTYITSWPSSGWTNDVMTYMNLIYLAVITQRVPILPHFTPGHVQGASMLVGKIFDLPGLSEALGMPILEWHEVKDPKSTVIDTLGCWNIWQAVQENEAYPRPSVAPKDLRIDLSYTQAPSWVRLRPGGENQNHATFWSLARLGFPEGQAEAQGSDYPSAVLMCIDYLYYVSTQQHYEFGRDYSPAWRFVGTHMYWHESLLELTAQYLEEIIGSAPDGELPLWIAIHARRDDFDSYCNGQPLEECFAPLSAIARRVQEVKDELMEKHGLAVEHVIMTSDERDEAWWKDVATFGWHRIDHSITAAEHGPWYPVLIDAVIQSLASGLVGTDGSTMSLIAARRVADWQHGVTRMVKWGRPGADDH